MALFLCYVTGQFFDVYYMFFSMSKYGKKKYFTQLYNIQYKMKGDQILHFINN